MIACGIGGGEGVRGARSVDNPLGWRRRGALIHTMASASAMLDGLRETGAISGA